VAGVEENPVLAKEVDGEGFIGGRNGGVGGGVGGVAEGGVPAGFRVEEFTGGVGGELGLEVGEIFLDTGEELRAQGVALGEEHGESGLSGGAEGEIGVGDDFEAIEDGANLRGGAGNGEPSDFHLWESGNFGETAEGKGEDFGIGGKRFSRSGVEGEIKENFVYD
jgi:hypothetical protein